jgi:squalene-hopene/tetraprenyl-beta-curcumene cyclase
VNRTPDIRAALGKARQQLWAARNAAGHWSGELSSSALSTATAVCALSTVAKSTGTTSGQLEALIWNGFQWLARNRNSDGGWGDTNLSQSNISTTTLCWAAFASVPGATTKFDSLLAGAENWLTNHAGGIDPEHLAAAIIARYGQDRTFSVPILTMCAISGRFGAGEGAWRHVLPLPFELAACPHRWFAIIGLPVVSYALPALIAIGQARHANHPPKNPLLRHLRNFVRPRTARLLGEIQPESGGFLEATPLTSFVVMSLAASSQTEHPVVAKGVDFIVKSARGDGSWPIDTNLATWVTTLSVNALAQDRQFAWTMDERRQTMEWLLAQQSRCEHPYTHAQPGAWAWTDLPGGVPDADDTAGALLALRYLGSAKDALLAAAKPALQWLLDLQNRDGGIPTFCRGWGKLPFDRSSPDLTAHALRAWSAWQNDLPRDLQRRINQAKARAWKFLARSQGEHGWAPLWFGNQHAPDEVNLTYGNARVLEAINPDTPHLMPTFEARLARSIDWLLQAQTREGAWSGAVGGSTSIEETALAVAALAHLLGQELPPSARRVAGIRTAVAKGATWLANRVADGAWTEPSPIGFYFAKLWYYERLYPMIFTVEALGKAASVTLPPTVTPE